MKYEPNYITISKLIRWNADRKLNLTPVFQRDSVWGRSAREKLIETIFQGYPFPAIFIAEEKNGNRIVLDGKQRIESIFYFFGVKKRPAHTRPLKVSLPQEEHSQKYTYQDLKKIHKRLVEDAIKRYQIPCITIKEASFSELVDLFVRINTTGVRLSRQEVIQARFFKDNYFLEQATKLAHAKRPFFLSHKILTDNDILRMKHVELVCELMASIQAARILDGKRQIETIIASPATNKREIDGIIRTVNSLLKLAVKILPDLRTTRFRKRSDFYTLMMLLWSLQQEDTVFEDKKTNAVAAHLLEKFASQVDRLSDLNINRQAFGPNVKAYWDTVQGHTDSRKNRVARENILREVIKGLFSAKDSLRFYTEEQRRILWHSSREKKCAECGKVLNWNDFTVDHVYAHTRGGKTDLANAQLMCRSCNSRFGKKIKKKRK